MPTEHKVFVSYSSRDRDVVLPVIERLRADGLSLWIDVSDMQPGDQIVPVIRDAIRQSAAAIFFVSQNSREWQWLELGGAFAIHDRVVPVRLDDSQLPAFLSPRHCLDWASHSDGEYAELLESCRRFAATTSLPAPSSPPLRTLDEILGHSNRAALSLYNQFVMDRPAEDDAFVGVSRHTLAGGYWDSAAWANQRDYVDLRLDNAEFVLQKVCQTLAQNLATNHETQLWLIGDAGAGKTTAMYRIYFEILQARARSLESSLRLPYPIPFLIQLQKVQKQFIDELSSTKDESDFIAAILNIWLARRHLEVTEYDRASLQASFYEAICDGRIVLLIDSYDELGRVAVELGLFQQLFRVAKHYVAASRPELYRQFSPSPPLRIQPEWDLPTIRDHLTKRFSKSIALGLAAHIERNNNARWLCNPRYLYQLGRVLEGESRSGTTSVGDVLELIENGQYEFLKMLFERMIDRLITILLPSGALAGRLDLFSRNVRLHLREIAQNQVETGSLVMPKEGADEIWSALASHASEITRTHSDSTSAVHQLYLHPYNWVDFFLVDFIMQDLLEEGPDRPLTLRHFWTRTLLAYTAEFAERHGNLRSLAWRIRERLAVVRSATLASSEQASRVNDGVNLVQLMIRVQWQLDDDAKEREGDPHSHDLRFSDEDFSLLNLDSIDLHRLAFQRCNFSHARLTRANLQRALFEDCDFSNADLREALADHATFVDCTFTLDALNAEGQSPVRRMSTQGTTVKFYGDDRLAAFRDHGALSERSRYRSPFGKLFYAKQRPMLGPGLGHAETRYLSEIATALRSAPPHPKKHLIDLMAGGGNQRLINLLGSDPDLSVLAIDRDGGDMSEVVSAVGHRFAMLAKEIDGETDLAALAADYFDPPVADLVIAKKALHELPREAQKNLIASIARVLRDSGRLILFTDSPYEIDDSGYGRLQRLRQTLLTHTHNIEPIRAELFALRFDPSSRSDLAVFSNLWVHLKDWANGNEIELGKRYFSGAHEIIQWARSAGLRQIGESYQNCYQLVARRFNESGINLASHRAEEDRNKRGFRNVAFYRDALEGSERFRLFDEFVEHHLWDAGIDRPTALGAALNADRVPLELHQLLPDLDFESIGLGHGTGVGFDFPIHVLTFERSA